MKNCKHQFFKIPWDNLCTRVVCVFCKQTRDISSGSVCIISKKELKQEEEYARRRVELLARKI